MQGVKGRAGGLGEKAGHEMRGQMATDTRAVRDDDARGGDGPGTGCVHWVWGEERVSYVVSCPKEGQKLVGGLRGGNACSASTAFGEL